MEPQAIQDHEKKKGSGSNDGSTCNSSSKQGIALLSTCMEVYECLKTLYAKCGESVISPSLWKAIEDTKLIIDNKCICISVLGQHNCGKSTFINALLGDEFLPMYPMIESTVRVEIQHDNAVHPGVCSDDCSHLQSEGTQCPWLEIAEESVNVGTNKICQHLRQINKESETYHECKIVLKVNIPLLSDQVPQDWQLRLIDNPGFGDARHHVAQVASESVHTSSMYIYLLETSSIGGVLAARFFKDLSCKDQGAIQDGRLIVGIAKFDNILDNSDDDTTQELITEEIVRKKILTSVEDAVGVQMTEDNVIPLCGRWALAASKLSNSIDSDVSEDNVRKRLRSAQKMLEKCPYVDLPGGQDQSQKELILKLNSCEVVTNLEAASGFHTLKQRLHSVGKICIKVLSAKIYNQFASLLDQVTANIDEEWKEKKEQYEQKEKEHKNSKTSLTKISDSKEVLEATTNGGREEAKPILKKFEERYKSDIEKSLAHTIGRERMKELVQGFKEECKQKVNTHQFGPMEFETRLQEFLEKCESKLQQDIYTTCSFPSAYNYQSYLSGTITQKVEILNSAARELTSIRATERGNDDMLASLYHAPSDQSNIQLTSRGPDLKFVKDEVINAMMLLVAGDQDLEVDVHRELPRCHTPSLHDIRQATPIQSFSMRIRRFFRSICEKFPTTRRLLKSEEGSEPPGSEPPSNEGDNTFHEWTNELDLTVDGVLDLIDEACEEYFDDIKSDVVKHFFNGYCTKTKEHLHKFDEEFSKELKKKEEKLNKEITDLDSNIQMLSECREELESLHQKLIDCAT